MSTRARVVCFIDSSNLFSYLRDAFGSGKYRQGALCEALSGPGRDLVQWRFYTAAIPEGESDRQRARYASQQRFFEVIRSRPRGVLVLGRFLVEGQIPHQSLREKGVDVHLAVDLVRLASRDAYDVAVVLSGDEDLVPAIEAVREDYSKRVEVALPTGAQAYHLSRCADAFVEITREMFETVKM